MDAFRYVCVFTSDHPIEGRNLINRTPYEPVQNLHQRHEAISLYATESAATHEGVDIKQRGGCCPTQFAGVRDPCQDERPGIRYDNLQMYICMYLIGKSHPALGPSILPSVQPSSITPLDS